MNLIARCKNLWRLSEYELRYTHLVSPNDEARGFGPPVLTKTITTMQRKPATIINLDVPDDGIPNEPQSN